MKKAISVILIICLLLPGIALAETIREQVNAPETLQDTFTSNTGRMTIDINAAVIVPDISTLYEIDVTPRLFNNQELTQLVKGFQQDDPQLVADYQVLVGDWKQYEYKNADIHLTAYGRADNGTWSDVTAKCVIIDETYLTGYMSALQRWHEGPAAHCRYTLEEAKAIADQAAAIVAPNYAFSAWGLMELYPRERTDHGMFRFGAASYSEELGAVTLTITGWKDSEGFTWTIPEDAWMPREWYSRNLLPVTPAPIPAEEAGPGEVGGEPANG